ncbi:hypothetical protein FO519_004653 [Halicephalobus sp. NKZ332]|nr:hypothetical protein FO519_004653 [Halicephalobus sp. NKZ332]
MMVTKLIFLFSLFVLVFSKNLCIDGFYEKDGLCWSCSPNCETCNGPDEDSCTRCPKYSKRWGLTLEDVENGNSFLCSLKDQDGMVSVVDCFEDQFASSGNKDSVGISTFSCSSRCHNEGRKIGDFSECPIVSERKIREGNTTGDSAPCGEREFFNGLECFPCPEDCERCDQYGCFFCSSDVFTQIYQERVESFYVNCTKNCTGISPPSFNGLKTCLVRKLCEKGYYRNDIYKCVECSLECETCEYSATNCITYKCYPSCSSCAGPYRDQCTKCIHGYLKTTSKDDFETFTCEKECPKGTYQSEDSCRPCDSSCSTCNGPSDRECTSCDYNKVLTELDYDRKQGTCAQEMTTQEPSTKSSWGYWNTSENPRDYDYSTSQPPSQDYWNTSEDSRDYNYSNSQSPSLPETGTKSSYMSLIVGIIFLFLIFVILICLFIKIRNRKTDRRQAEYLPVQSVTLEERTKSPENPNMVQNI